MPIKRAPGTQQVDAPALRHNDQPAFCCNGFLKSGTFDPSTNYDTAKTAMGGVGYEPITPGVQYQLVNHLFPRVEPNAENGVSLP